MPTCEVVSPVWSFTIEPVPAPQPVSPPDNATVMTGETVSFTVSSAIEGDIGTRIVFGDGVQITAYGYGVGSAGNESYFRVQVGNQPGALNWTTARADCRLGSSCPLVYGPTRTLRVVAPSVHPGNLPPHHRAVAGLLGLRLVGGVSVCTPENLCPRSRHAISPVWILGAFGTAAGFACVESTDSTRHGHASYAVATRAVPARGHQLEVVPGIGLDGQIGSRS